MKPRILPLDPKQIDQDELRTISGELLRGKVVAFPTETVYGLAACVRSPQAVSRLYELKGRDRNKPFSYHIGSLVTLERLDIVQSRIFRYLANLFWPGPVTFIALNRRDEKVGIRFPKHPIAQKLLDWCSEPVLATSANRSGDRSPQTADDVLRNFPDQIDIVIDSGKCEGGSDSTIVDVVQRPPQVLRRGPWIDRVEEAIRKIELGRYPRRKILIVCTGNTCRSPMAEGWLKAELKRKGLEEQIEVSSCGICAREGASATAEAVLTLRNDEISVEGFQSHLCRREDVIFADLILAMGEEHERFIVNLYPPVKDRVIILGIEDPIGMTLDFYERCYRSIQEKLSKVWDHVVQ
ncbi:MAG: threonylcarbamoyl-AMP synthase [Omnitrophica bacterium RIFCSPLOWO2_12_FULL_50_11]|nr:MAG: threonylcarbamoyl-AMP synthase [Omnitrophica bacterium RIFCSPLOWO2_12_FULL_50_11]